MPTMTVWQSNVRDSLTFYDGVAIECQGFPDAPNKPSFPSPVLRPGDEYSETIRFTFK